MDLVRKLVRLLRRILGREEDVDSIIRPISRIARKLQEHAAEQLRAAKEIDATVLRLQQEAKQRCEEASRAELLSIRYCQLLGS